MRGNERQQQLRRGERGENRRGTRQGEKTAEERNQGGVEERNQRGGWGEKNKTENSINKMTAKQGDDEDEDGKEETITPDT